MAWHSCMLLHSSQNFPVPYSSIWWQHWCLVQTGRQWSLPYSQPGGECKEEEVIRKIPQSSWRHLISRQRWPRSLWIVLVRQCYGSEILVNVKVAEDELKPTCIEARSGPPIPFLIAVLVLAQPPMTTWGSSTVKYRDVPHIQTYTSHKVRYRDVLMYWMDEAQNRYSLKVEICQIVAGKWMCISLFSQMNVSKYNCWICGEVW